MKFKIKENWRAVVAVAFLSLACALPVAAQKERRNGSPEKEQLYIISAKAGGINYVTGAVRVTRDGTKQTQILATGDELNDKDRVSVGVGGRIEILLNPGSFLRLGESSEFELTDTSLESLNLKLAKGNALIEAAAVGGERGADISINTPQAKIRLEKSGIYRINTDINATEIYVWKGAATVGNEIIKAGRKTVVGNNGTVAAAVKFDKDDSRDALDLWSKDRAKELAKLNAKLQRRELANAFTGFEFNGFSSRFGGFWVLNRLTGTYCYVPFGFGFWDSPYGYGYNSGIWWNYNWRPVVITPRVINPNAGDPSDNAPIVRTPSVIMTKPLPPPSPSNPAAASDNAPH